MSNTTTLSDDLRIEIPDAIRRRLGWEAGQELVLLTKTDQLVILPRPKREDIAGIAKGASADNVRDRD